MAQIFHITLAWPLFGLLAIKAGNGAVWRLGSSMVDGSHCLWRCTLGELALRAGMTMRKGKKASRLRLAKGR